MNCSRSIVVLDEAEGSACGFRLRDQCALTASLLLIACHDSLDVIAGLGERRDAMILLDVSRTCVVCCERKLDVPLEPLEHQLQITCPSLKRLTRVVRVRDAEHCSRCRDH